MSPHSGRACGGPETPGRCPGFNPRNRFAISGDHGPGAVYSVHDHPYRKVLVVAGGSITFSVSGGRRVVAMRPGDRLDLPPGTPHSAVVGPDGVVCLEAHLEESA